MFKKILAIKLRPLGDTVLMAASLAELRERFPQARIDALVLKRWEGLFDAHPACDRVIGFERREGRTARARAVARMGLALRREKYDLAVCFHASPSSALLAFSTGARVRSIHFHFAKDRNRYSTVEIPDRGRMKANLERDLDAIRALGFAIPEGKRQPRLWLRNLELLEAESLFHKLKSKGPALGLTIGVKPRSRSWPLDEFAKLAKRWGDETGGSTVAFASEEEREVALELQSRAKALGVHVELLLGLPIRQLMGAFTRLSVLVGNDSGPRHIAVALNCPTVTLIGPDGPTEWHPYALDRHPYFHRDCALEGHRCMSEVGANDVFEQAKRVSR